MLKKLIMDEDGQGMVEYVLIIAFIALIVVGALGVLGTTLIRNYEDFGQMFSS